MNCEGHTKVKRFEVPYCKFQRPREVGDNNEYRHTKHNRTSNVQQLQYWTANHTNMTSLYTN